MSKNYNVTLHQTLQRLKTTSSSSGNSSRSSDVSLKYKHSSNSQGGSNSPRVNGRLMLQSNAFNRDYRREVYTPGFLVREYDGYWYVKSMGYDGPGYSITRNSSPYITGNVGYGNYNLGVRESAILDFYNDIGNSKINLAVAFAERQRTINLIGSTARKLASSFHYLRRGNFKRAANILGIHGSLKSNKDSLSEKWLELQYGWRPLLNDVYGAMIATTPTPPMRPLKVTRSANDTFKYTTSNTKWTVKYKESVTCKGFAQFSNLAITSELGLNNPALVAWELVPYSFVVDWFIPIGDWISAQTALVGVNMHDVSVTVTKTWEHDGVLDKLASVTSQKGTTYSGPPAKTKAFRKVKSRTLGMPSIPPPTFSPGLSIHQSLSAIALLNQRFSR